MIKGLHTIWCQTSDMKRSVAFYRDVLGLQVGYESEHWTEIMVGSHKIALHQTIDGAPSPHGVYHQGWMLGIETDDIVSLRQTLDSQGVRVHGGFHDIPTGVILDFQDPDGNQIEAIEVGKTAAELAERAAT